MANDECLGVRDAQLAAKAQLACLSASALGLFLTYGLPCIIRWGRLPTHIIQSNDPWFIRLLAWNRYLFFLGYLALAPVLTLCLWPHEVLYMYRRGFFQNPNPTSLAGGAISWAF